ncbi:transcriptional regulatory protein DegU [mine drainage metagenome]|uniref:Transcriptional regulatory protein DegU n=1 Tax=mine drainage metagenome TaxID=410659 RepID=A0A1J5RP10_9ZZZZ
MKTTIVLAEDHAIVREGLITLLGLSPDFEVVGEAADGREAVSLTRKLRPMVVVMDIAMPVLNGFEATRQIKAFAPETRILVLSAHSDDEYVAHMALVGASGYLVKQNSGQALVRAIKEIAAGRPYFSPTILKRMQNAERRAREIGVANVKASRQLTPREAEVFQQIVEGAPNKQIGSRLGISIKTVEKHRQRLMDKLDIHDTAGLTRYAIASGVIESSVQMTVE